VTKLNKKVFAFIVMSVSMLLLADLVSAQPETVTVWTDKHEYSPGQTGRLYVAYNNIREDPVTIRNITVVFEEWWAYINDAWVGNLTYEPSEDEKTIAEHTTRVFEISFTVPSDGRARRTDAVIEVYTNLPKSDKPSSDPEISVFETPVDMEQIITLFTIQVVLLIVCTIIIAATIFLSARRPQVTWKPTEKTE
jgi:hypothetical protein